MHSLRTRLILSHILSLLVVIPAVGIALIYLLETEVFLAESSNELEEKGLLVAALAADYPQIWDDPAQAQLFADRIGDSFIAQVMLLDTRGVLLAHRSRRPGIGGPAVNPSRLPRGAVHRSHDPRGLW